MRTKDDWWASGTSGRCGPGPDFRRSHGASLSSWCGRVTVLETLLEHRAVSLRVPDVLDVFRVEDEVLQLVVVVDAPGVSRDSPARRP